MRRLVLLIAGVVLVLASGAAAKNADQVRQALIRARVSPQPLYPAVLPSPLYSGSDATLTHGRHNFSVTYQCGVPAEPGCDLVILTFSRGPASDVARLVNFVKNVQRGRVRRVRVNGRTMYSFDGDIQFGYAWGVGRYGYIVSEHVSNQVGWKFARQFVESLAPLGKEWAGRTSQGQPLTLYRSRYGLDWSGGWDGKCADGSQVSSSTEEDIIDVKPDQSFSDSYSYTQTTSDGTNLRIRVGFGGRFQATSRNATGYLAVHEVNADDPTDQYWDCQAFVSWQAHQI